MDFVDSLRAWSQTNFLIAICTPTKAIKLCFKVKSVSSEEMSLTLKDFISGSFLRNIFVVPQSSQDHSHAGLESPEFAHEGRFEHETPLFRIQQSVERDQFSLGQPQEEDEADTGLSARNEMPSFDFPAHVQEEENKDESEGEGADSWEEFDIQ